MLDGYVTVERARLDHGVALDATGAVDEAETERLRADMRAGAPPLIDRGEWGDRPLAVESS